MAIRAIVLSRLFLLPSLFAASTILAQAQSSDSSHPIVLKKITVSLVQALPAAADANATPNAPSSNERDWLKVVFQYDVNPPGGKNYLNTATFHVWIEGRDLEDPNFPGPDGVGVAFSGVVSYVNLYKGPNGYGVVYLAPSTVERYAGRTGSSAFTRMYDVHVEASADGQKICFLNNKDEGNKADSWFQGLKPISNMVYTLSQTPFYVTDYGLYPQEKLKGAAVESSE